MNRPIRAISITFVFVLAVAVSGCATRKYVTHEIGKIEPQVAEVRDAQAQQAERIDAVDRRAQVGLDAANAAGAAVDRANARAVAAGQRAADADRRAEAAHQTAKRALNRLDTMEGQIDDRFANVDKYVVADQKTIGFTFDSDVLTPDMLSRLDDIAGEISNASAGYLIELQGFTDSTGSEKYNVGLSERRAESVLRYLVSKDVPLYRISIVGLGTTKPIADNKTAAGRELNRRVEVRLLLSGGAVSAATR
jgi:outer membrane protein OmpA-like peptidoglycan-associated protein